MKGPKTDADMALNFVRQDELTPDELQKLVGQQGSVIVAEKFRNAANGDEVLPSAAAQQVQERIPFAFGVNDFTRLRKKWGIGPVKSQSKNQLPNSEGYCLYSPTFKQYAYLPKLVDRMTSSLSTEEEFRALIGRNPSRKAQGE